MDEELSGELLERADRDQAARISMRPGHGLPEWEAVVEPVDRDNTARLPEANRARLLAAEGLDRRTPG